MTVDGSPAPAHTESQLPPHVVVLQMMMGLWKAQILSAVAQFGIADHIADGLYSADEIAHEIEADPDALFRLMRAASSLGILKQVGSRHFNLTPVGEWLRANSADSLRDLVLAETAPGHWLPWGRLYDAVKSGKPVTRQTLGMEVWEYYAKNQEEGGSFARGMGNLSAIASAEVLTVYDASSFRRIVDVGGSQGVLLTGFLAAANQARGVLFDRPDVIDGVRSRLGGNERVELVAGDFLSEAPADGDLYLLKSILHDWDDEHCTRILTNIHRAASAQARVLVVEMLLPDEPQPTPVTLMDMNMLVMLGGRERTAAEFRQLLASSGWKIERVIPTPGLFSVIEAVRSPS
jgi:hypothetical protein